MNIVNLAVGIILLVVLLIGAALPVAEEVINATTVTGPALTVLNLIPLFIALAVIIGIAVGAFGRGSLA